MADHLVLRIVGLDHHPSLFFPPGAAGHLAQKLESPFEGTEIGAFEYIVRIEDAHEGNMVEVQPFGDHLRADQDVGAALLERLKDVPVGVFPTRGIGVHPQDAGRLEQPGGPRPPPAGCRTLWCPDAANRTPGTP